MFVLSVHLDSFLALASFVVVEDLRCEHIQQHAFAPDIYHTRAKITTCVFALIPQSILNGARSIYFYLSIVQANICA